jgi:hypothetical protein
MKSDRSESWHNGTPEQLMCHAVDIDEMIQSDMKDFRASLG